MAEKAGYSQTGQLNVAVVGLGWWGKAIIGELKNNNKLRVARAVDIAPASGDWARAENIPFTDDYSAVLADPAIGAVVLTTPHTQHRAQVVAAAQAKKHVFCEKPLALTRAEAIAEVEACKANNVVLAVGHEHRFKQAIVDILRMVRSGELGTIQMTEATLTFELRPFAADNWRIQKSEAPGGPSMTALGIHGLDLCVAVNGPAQSVTANMSSLISDKSETLGIMIRFKNGANAMLSSLFGPPFSIRFGVFGSKGMGGSARQIASAGAYRLGAGPRQTRCAAGDDRISGRIHRPCQSRSLRRCRSRSRRLSGRARRNDRQHRGIRSDCEISRHRQDRHGRELTHGAGLLHLSLKESDNETNFRCLLYHRGGADAGGARCFPPSRPIRQRRCASSCRSRRAGPTISLRA